MLEKLVYFEINSLNKKILLYTYNEPYNGMNEYLKIYALEFNENNEPIIGNMSDAIHNEVRIAIAMMGKNQLNGITILPFPQANIENITGKAFAIPAIFKNNILETVKQNVSIENGTNKDSISLDSFSQQTPQNVHRDVSDFNQMQEINLDSNLNNTSKVDFDFASSEQESYNANQIDSSNTFVDGYTDKNVGANIQGSNEEKKNLDSIENVSKEEPYNPMEQFMSADVEKKPEIENASLNKDEPAMKNDDQTMLSEAISSDVPSLTDVENALSIITKYINFMKLNDSEFKQKKDGKGMNEKNMVSLETEEPSGFDSLNDSSIKLDNNSSSNQSENLINDPVFPFESQDSFGTSEDMNKESSVYVASQNLGQNPINNGVFTSKNSEIEEEPVIMPDNFVGNQNQKFEITGLGPSTLPVEDGQTKFVA